LEISSQNTHPLLVLNASAGSGKTYRLVLEYLSLLFDAQGGAGKYRHLVAMTFTNKAAYEMKERILDALHDISTYKEGNEGTLRLMEKISESTGMPVHSFPTKASEILSEILHGYEDFLISTIDKFNLRLIRSFNRDLNLPQEFEVILNESDILEKVIDSILAKVGTAENQALTQLVENYTKKNLDEETNWNFRSQLIDFCGILSKERYIELVESLLEQDYHETELQEAAHRQDALLADLIRQGANVSRLFEESGLEDAQLPQKSKTSNPIRRLGSLVQWPEKGLLTDTVIKLLNEGKYEGIFSTELTIALSDLIDFYNEQNESFVKLKFYRETFYNLALLQYVAKEMDVIRENEHFIRISEFNRLISGLVQHQHAPYIYERLGNKLHHFLLDEFQDTSRMQWLNMIPLIEESISKNHKNLIVGDAKQSIYRFNNGLAEQFVALPSIYNPEKNPKVARQSEYFLQMGMLEELADNHRSGKSIVEFNNKLFEASRSLIPNEAKDFYKSVHQNAIKTFEGYVEIKSMEAKNSSIDIFPEIIQIIERCMADGFKPGDICILSEKNDQGNKIAQYLTENKYKVVSADSLLIHSDARIRLIVSYLKIRNKTSNDKEFMKFADLYLRFTNDDPELAYLALFDVNPNGRREFNVLRFITTYFHQEESFFINYTNLYDLIQKFYDLMGWQETQDVYLHHFADLSFNFQIGRKVDLNSFIEYYEKNQHKLAIQFPKTNDAVQIMTIHKSKGLQFPVVILPNVNFNISDTMSYYLIPGADQVYYRKLSKNSPLSEIRAFSEKESNQFFMDKLNLLYVAMTRPVHRLYVFNLFESNKMGKPLHDLLVGCYPEHLTDGVLSLSLGQEEAATGQVATDTFYHPMEFGDRLWYPELVVRQGFDSDQTLLGKAFHSIMATCVTLDEVPEHIKVLEDQSEVSPDASERILHMAERVFKDATYATWIKNATNIQNEAWIMAPDGSLVRPDKIIVLVDRVIVIDFKTGQAQPKHRQQLDAYKLTLSQMYNLPIQGYLYYTQSGEWVSC
jgi:ATP-dependent exoDNAse (exonuclease V) beta subunit